MSSNSTARAHDIKNSLALSFDLEGASFWQEVYSSLFPDMAAFIRHSDDGDHQRLGIDTSVIMSNSKVFTVDEKLRYADFGDIALEEWGDYGHRLPGWAVKSLLCDFILYAVLPAGKAFLLPTIQTQNAWRTHGEEWKQEYKDKIIIAPNRDGRGREWQSVSWGIPVSVLYKAIGGQLRMNFQPVEDYQS